MSAIVHLPYVEPYRHDLLVGFLKFRAIDGVEVVDEEGVYRRTLRFDADEGEDVGWIEVRNLPEEGCVSLTVSDGLVGHTDEIADMTRRLFDTDTDPAAVETGLADFHERVDPKYHVPGVRLPVSFDGFEMTLRAVIGQQITVKAANTLAGRIAASFGTPYEGEPAEGLRTLFPAPARFCEADAVERLGELGVIRQRAEAICAIARMCQEGKLTLAPGADPERTEEKLVSIRGIGPWTAQYVLMRAVGSSDGFPTMDYGIKHAFPDLKPKQVEALSQAWRPWRSYAVMSIWSTS